MFLPPDVMMMSFIRSVILDEAFVVDGADVAGMQPALRVEGFGGFLRLVQIAHEQIIAP